MLGFPFFYPITQTCLFPMHVQKPRIKLFLMTDMDTESLKAMFIRQWKLLSSEKKNRQTPPGRPSSFAPQLGWMYADDHYCSTPIWSHFPGVRIDFTLTFLLQLVLWPLSCYSYCSGHLKVSSSLSCLCDDIQAHLPFPWHPYQVVAVRVVLHIDVCFPCSMELETGL